MMPKKALLFLLCLLPCLGAAQTVLCSFSGSTYSFKDNTKLLDNVEIIIKKGNDTLEVLHSNSEGAFSWISELKIDDEIKLIAKQKYYHDYEVKFKVPSHPTSITINFELIELLILRINNPVFEEGVSDQFTDFDVELFKHQLRQSENFCIEFIHVTYTDESDEIADLRIEHFKQYLFENGMNLDNFHFKTENMRFSCNSDDCRGRIEGEMITLDEKCKRI